MYGKELLTILLQHYERGEEKRALYLFFNEQQYQPPISHIPRDLLFSALWDILLRYDTFPRNLFSLCLS
jgi:hypothetical protein